MINHARTLLLADRGGDDPAPWDRYYPVDYTPIKLPDYLESVRRALVGIDGWWDRTYRVELLLTVLNSPRYASKYPWMDSRVTPPQVEPFLYTEPEISVTRIVSPAVDTCVGYITKTYDGALPIKRTWQVFGNGGTQFTVKYLGRLKTVEANYSDMHNGWLLPIGPDFDLLFSGSGATGDLWNVRSYKKPVNMFAQYPAIVGSLIANWTYQLFSVYSPSEEPINEYGMWYRTCVNAEDRVAAVLLAYLLKTTLLL